MKKILVTGSSGLIGSEVCTFFHDQGFQVFGLDNNQRAVFFGSEGDTRWNQERLEKNLKNFNHIESDIRDRESILNLFSEIKPDVVVHTAAQPSHDKAAAIPFDDFDTNAVGTLNLLEASRQHSLDSPFIHMSTNKVYGDAPNSIKMKELESRWEYDDPEYEKGISENFTIDQSKHSLFGASKVASDIMVQEYGRYFSLPTCCLRGGCLTGPNHSGVQLHGFLSYLMRCNIEQKEYTIFGYKGKQVRDNIHSFDVVNFMWEFSQNPKSGEVYNLGGGKDNACSLLEAFEKAGNVTGNSMNYVYSDNNREGDHICYYSDLSKMKSHFPNWEITKNLDDIFEEIAASWSERSRPDNI